MCCPWSKQNVEQFKTIEDVNGIFDENTTTTSDGGVNTISGQIVFEQPLINDNGIWKTVGQNDTMVKDPLAERRVSQVCTATEYIVETETVAEVLTPIIFAKARLFKEKSFNGNIDYDQCLEDKSEVALVNTSIVHENSSIRRTGNIESIN